ncbi:hypothetical protein G6F57_002514 [Rhizopus arrhizus]|uniref:NEDD8-activating enzyme E1 regulatory subunit n=1 Tax=Rhizopus oryzae TaxID=64495 RepID=A0A9P6XGB5_RHIOR|nr:hypothetical protein G6F30_003677 [Rhizopus arrhizus]KAG1412555.1 hypothetical protein G6F58_007953 [Rhizopus delemar]KAG0981402.1 hypothetical protein G6F29_007093 [Rhizopus arrhizus]KAG0999688.1 hypothetical protein G6F28_000773 [Rhizopus arrhizus]KAG1011830.1 hypothetical protein G6F27_003385 [Rhizopus arrhizus]
MISILWATTGQQALEEAHVCLLYVTSTGCEIIKNLVLPGIGNVTIIDHSKVTEEDVQNNFFLDPESIGQSKAKSAAELLQELNEDAKVAYIEKVSQIDPLELIRNDTKAFDEFTMIITVNMLEDDVLKLASVCQDKTLFAVKSNGLIGMFSIQAPEHTIIESHPENAVDLRLSCPFTELVDYASTFDLDALDQTDHSHVPFVIIILKFVDAYKAKHEGKVPQSYQERKELIQMIHEGMRIPDEENFHEAVSHVWRLSSTASIPSEIQQIFDDPSCQNANANSPYFWILAKAVRDFVENEGQGQLPLSGKLPDMKADTMKYIGLQNVYRQKALFDLNAVKERVKILLKDGDQIISDEIVQTFCKNTGHIKVIQYRPFSAYYGQVKKIVQWVKEEENICYGLVFKAADKFNTLYGRPPASLDDYLALKEQTLALLESISIPLEQAQAFVENEAMEKALKNFVRFGNKEVANIAALLGGIVAQEAIKLITHQYIPINNTCIFNGITATSNVFEL